jgi:hypothetical protein
MMDAPQPWPAKLTREQAKGAKQRERDFQAIVKAHGKASGWRYARADLFKQDGDWFVSNMPSLAWERGAWSRLTVKPMALDPLFWDIVGLPENNHLPLSFRATGAWVLQPRWREELVGASESSVVELAHQTVAWSKTQVAASDWSIDGMIADVGSDRELRSQRRALAICLHLLKGDLDKAQHLCRQAGDQNSLAADGGGFSTNHADGTRSTFIQQALDWIAKERRKALRETR